MCRLFDALFHVVVVCGSSVGLEEQVVVARVETVPRADFHAVVQHRAAACCEAARVGDGRRAEGAVQVQPALHGHLEH